MTLFRRVRACLRPLGVVFPLTILGLAMIAVGYVCGLAGSAPAWLIGGLTLALGVTHLPVVERWALGSAPYRSSRIWLRNLGHISLITATGYLVGWGPVVGVANVAVAATLAYIVASDTVWISTMTIGIAGAVVGQTAIACGVVDSYIPQPQAHVVALVNVVTSSMLIWLLGWSARRLQRAARERTEAEQRFRALVQDSSDVVSILGADQKVRYVSPAVERLIGYTPEQVVAMDPAMLVHPDDLATAREALHQATVRADDECVEVRVRHADGCWRWHEVRIRDLTAVPAVHGVVINQRDISERRQLQERLAYEATHDVLTGLANRAAFRLALPQRELPSEHWTAVAFIDLDGFKRINDELGHQAGDRLLAAVAEVLRRNTRDGDLVSRLGGDEFGIVLADLSGPSQAKEVAERLVGALREPVRLPERLIKVGASIGIAMAPPGHRCDGDRLVALADQAMYRAKQRSAGDYEVMLAVDPVEDDAATSRGTTGVSCEAVSGGSR